MDAEGNRKPYPPTLKVQLRKRDGKFETEVYDDKKRPLADIPLEDIIVKGSVLTALIQCTGVWFAGGKFGLSWKAIQIRADKVPQSLRGFAFLEEEGDAAAVAAAVPTPAPAVTSQNKFAALHDDDEVNDDEALAPPAAAEADAPEADDEEAPIPVPPKKTTVTAKAVVKKVVKKA